MKWQILWAFCSLIILQFLSCFLFVKISNEAATKTASHSLFFPYGDEWDPVHFLLQILHLNGPEMLEIPRGHKHTADILGGSSAAGTSANKASHGSDSWHISGNLIRSLTLLTSFSTNSTPSLNGLINQTGKKYSEVGQSFKLLWCVWKKGWM